MLKALKALAKKSFSSKSAAKGRAAKRPSPKRIGGRAAASKRRVSSRPSAARPKAPQVEAPVEAFPRPFLEAEATPETVLRSYARAFNNRDFGAMYDLLLKEAPARKRTTRAAFLKEHAQAAAENGTLCAAFKVLRTEIDGAECRCIGWEVRHMTLRHARMNNALEIKLRKTSQGWRIYGRRVIPFVEAAQAEMLSSSDFEGQSWS